MHFHQWNRRGFIALLGGAAAVLPLAAHAQQGERLRLIGVLMNLGADDRVSQARLTAFVQTLNQLGWTDGRNVRIEYRFGAGDNKRIRKHAEELVALAPDVILANAAPSVASLLQVTRTVPIVFAAVIDPVGAGFVASLARPGGNATGFTSHEFGLSAKWLELLKQIAPNVTRVAVLRDPTSPTGIGQLAALQSVAPSLGVELSPLGVHDADEIERGLAAFAGRSNGGLIATPSTSVIARRELIIKAAARHQLPAVYPYRFFVHDGGLLSYGADRVDQYRRAASYVDRILRGEKPADLPVQAPTKYETSINLKTAKALGLTVPPALLVAADEVIE
jgi:putative ABC transport system substrate-binding protein